MKLLSANGFVRSGPKGGLSPTLGDPCPVCRRTFVVGDYTTLLPAGVRLRESNAGSELHWDCARALVSKPPASSLP
jgi:hypothetical protein